MSAKLKVAMTVAGVAVIGGAIAVAPALQHVAWLKWIPYLVGAALMSPLFVAIWGGEQEAEAEDQGFKGFDETNTGDSMQDIWGMNGQDAPQKY
ncbi:hypothetical protein [Ralstonia mojiangensis]|uniref:hypothetical protein n=1 Tax=Ralstonia mojiangensis TaxID=2953895 RepID=UPI0021B244C7|nr:hypothetical protein [Ralstonia mojiangensis]MCT7325019.1 hypothetical protein [Ralstonia mojiangensis]